MAMLCPEHGMIEVVSGETLCPKCGLTVLDPSNPANRDAVDSIIAMRANRAVSEGRAVLIALLFIGLPIAIAALTTNDEVAKIAPYIGVLVILVIAVALSLRHREWRIPSVDPHARRNFLTSATMISFFICIAFVAVAQAVGIDSLAYARGDAPWRIATSMFTHAGALHLIGNMFALLLFGPAVDLRVGRWRTAIVLVVAAVVGTLAQAQYTSEPGVGFSGAIYGLFGATLALMPTRPQVLSLQGVVLPLPTWGWMFVFVPLYTVLAALDPSQHIGWVAHLGGFFAGLLVALPMRRVPPSAAWVEHEERRAGRLESLVKRAVAGESIDMRDEFGSTAGVSNPEIRAFIVAGRRRKIIVTAIGGGALIVLGLAAAGLGAYLDAPIGQRGKKINTIVVGLVMVVSGIAMIAQVVRQLRRRE